MASNINTTTINTTYPVAGQDNDSQGFRDNFSNTNSNFVETKTEIEDIQTKGIFKNALVGAGSLDNDMAGSIISAVTLTDARETVTTHVSTENPLNIGIKAGAYHTITPSSSFTLAFSDGSSADWPTTGSYSKVRLEVVIDSVAKTITLPASVSLGNVTGQSGQVITVSTPGTYVYELSTRDAGTTVSITEVSTPQFIPEFRTPATAIGASGDVKGMSAFDASYMYVCVADYDGATSIWHRTANATWV
jgi:hypothetical protein